MEKVDGKWNPLEEDYKNRRYNSYREGVGKDLQNRDISDVGSTTGSVGHKPVVLYVTNIPLEMDEIALQNIFEQEGKVVRVHIPVPSPEKVAQFNSKMGFVTMDNARGAQAAIENLHGFQVKNKTLSVKVKQSKEELARRRDQQERIEEFYRTLEKDEDRMAAGSSNGAAPPFGGSGTVAPQRTVRSAGPHGDAAAGLGSMDSRRAEDGGGKVGLLPVPGSRGSVLRSVVDPGTRARGQVMRSPPAPSMAGSDHSSDLCASCQKTASLRCKACRKVYYCNAICQRTHWPLHRKVCIYDTRVPTAPAPPPPPPQHQMIEPDFDNLDADVSEEFIMNNKEYLAEWLRMAEPRSDSSSSSGEGAMKTKPPGGVRQPISTPRSRPDPDGERRQAPQQRNGHPLQGPTNSQQQRNGHPFLGPVGGQHQRRVPGDEGGQHRRAGPQGMEGRDRGVPQDQGMTAGHHGRDGPGYQQTRDRRGEGPGWQGKRGPRSVQGDNDYDGPGQFQLRNGPQDGRGNQFRNGLQERGNPPKSGPQRERSNQFGPRQEGECNNQSRNGPPAERVQQSKSRYGPQQGRDGPDARGPGDRGDRPQNQRGEGFGSRPTGGGLGQEVGGPGPRNGEVGRGPPSQRQNERGSGQYRESQRGGPRNDKGPSKQQQERGGNRRQRREWKGGSGSEAGSVGARDADVWEQETRRSPLKPTTAASPRNGAARTHREGTSEWGTCGPAVGQGSASIVAPVVDNREPMDLVQLNTPTTVLVSHIDSPQRLWVQMTDQVTTLVPFIADIFSKFTGNERPVQKAEVGQLGVCEFMGELARVKVVSVTGSKVKVFYVDYGNSEEVQVSKLLPVPSELASLPALSMPCTLEVCPSEGGAWSEEVVEIMRGLFSYTELCTITVLRKQPTICEVTLVRNSDSLDATTFLKEKGYAVDPTQLTATPAPQLSSVERRRIMVGDMQSVTDQLSKGQRVEMVMMDPSHPLRMVLHIASLEVAFTQFSTNMGADYDSDPPSAYQPVKGEMVVGRFSEDSCWYRAEVEAVAPDVRTASLFYVDFGNREQRPFEEIRALKEVHATTPVHGVLCGLDITKHVGGEWGEDQVTTFMRCLEKYLREEGERFLCTVLVERKEEDGGTVWVDLVGKGLGTTLAHELMHHLGGKTPPSPSPPAALPSTPTLTPVTDVLANPPAPTQSARSTPAPSVRSVPEEEGSPQPVAASVASAAQLGRVSLPVGECVEVGIQDIESCHKFYVNTKTAEEDLNELRESMTVLCEGQQPPPACQAVSAGDVVLVKFTEDEQWYRGQVERLSDSGATCTVFFLDYGNKEDKEVGTLRGVPPQFLQMPAQAILCTLTGVPSPTSQDMEKRFRGLCLMTEATVRIVGVEGECHSVDVLTSDHVSVVSMLGLQPSPAPTPTPTTTHEKSEEGAVSSSLPPPLEPGDDDDDGSVHNARSSPSIQFEGVSGQLLVSPSPALEGAERVEEVESGLPDSAVDPPRGAELELVLTRNCLPVVAEDSQVLHMVVTYIVSPAHFYTMHKEHYIAQHDEGGMVPQLQEVNADCPPMDKLPAKGELLSGLFEGVWFRCEVEEVVSPEQVRVTFFDYGNEAVLDLADLRPLPRDLCFNYPLATIRCCLHDVGPASGGDSWDEDSVLLTRELMENKGVQLTVQAVQNSAHQVDVVTTDTQQDVAQVLVATGQVVSLSAPPPPPPPVTAAPAPPPPSAPPSTDATADAEKEALLRQMAELQARLAAMETK
ncbi:uncharacterized protein LOC143298070 [Babylonia areolata]|uniref:uncharacterized protein LOC143298070 n=1 Tax=Babylonia areolata TaxID=304850 RepID=UPI003FD11591